MAFVACTYEVRTFETWWATTTWWFKGSSSRPVMHYVNNLDWTDCKNCKIFSFTNLWFQLICIPDQNTHAKSDDLLLLTTSVQQSLQSQTGHILLFPTCHSEQIFCCFMSVLKSFWMSQKMNELTVVTWTLWLVRTQKHVTWYVIRVNKGHTEHQHNHMVVSPKQSKIGRASCRERV